MAKDPRAPKQRWSAAKKRQRKQELAEAERIRRGGKGDKGRLRFDASMVDRPDNDERGSDGPRKPYNKRRDGGRPTGRDDRRGGWGGNNRGERQERRDDRRGGWNRDERGDRDERRGGWNRDDRGDRRGDRGDRRGGWNSEDRGGRSERGRGSWNRDDRSDRGNRRDDRSGGWSRDDRGSRDDRRGGWNRDDRGDRRDDREQKRWNRDDRGGRRDDRRGGWNRDDPSDRGNRRDDRSGGWSRDDRGPRDDRRGGWSREDRGPRRDNRWDRDERRDRREDRGERRGGWDRGHRDDADENADQMEWSQATDATRGSDATAFADLGLPKRIVAVLSGAGIETPFPIQAVTIPDALQGTDILARAQTGSGKTLGFGLPLLARLAGGKPIKQPRAVVLAPTRELALQVADSLSPLADAVGLGMVLVAGGMSFVPQLRAFRRGVDIVIATPGRLIDLMEQGEADLGLAEVLVLDEADHMADLGFLPAVTQILEAVPDDAQKMLFSATLDDAVSTIVSRHLHNPVTHEVDDATASVTTMTHEVWHVDPKEKAAVGARLAHRPGRTIVFARTQRGVDRIASQFREAGVLAAPLHGGLTQGQRVRTLKAFKDSVIPVVVCTDVAARGIHVDDVSLVLHFDPPANAKDYLHRAGRTARAGRDGLVASMVLPQQRKFVRRLLQDAGVDAAVHKVSMKDDELLDRSGAHARTAAPIPDDELTALLAPPPQKRRHPRGTSRGGRPPFKRRQRR